MERLGVLRVVALLMACLAVFVVSSADCFATETEELRKELDSLKAKVAAMEGSLLEKSPAAKHDDGVATQFGRNLGIFGDINYYTDSRERRNKSFNIGSVGLYSHAESGRLNFMSELLIFEHNAKSGINIERIWIGYTFNDYLKLRAGRFHTALGYWNAAFHHGRYLYAPMDRPFFIDFEDIGGVIPAHIVGLEAAGSLGPLSYTAEVGNGPGLSVDPHWFLYSKSRKYRLAPNNQSDNNDSKMAAGRIAFEPGRMPWFSLGVSAANYLVQYKKTETAPVQLVDIYVHQAVYSGDMHIEKSGMELIGEYYLLKNGERAAHAFYGQLSYNIDSINLTPYARFARLDTKTGDPYLKWLAGGGERSETVFGVRYDIDGMHSAVKFQFRRDNMVGSTREDSFEAQWAFHF
ncbi:MAG: hypothetical protein OEV59_01900 [Deltaproteobacteria bacterium]|nr:hypothetical protein [Deltaproteobacteria bacterium]